MPKAITEHLKIALDLKTLITIITVVSTVTIGATSVSNKLDGLTLAINNHVAYVDDLVDERDNDHKELEDNDSDFKVAIATLETNMRLVMNNLGF